MTTITASFDSVDRAELAISRLRRAGSDFRIRVTGGLNSASPAASAYTASILYPYQPINLPQNFANEADYELGGRVLFTADILGLPIYHDSETQLHVTVDENSADQARSLLVNAGGHFVKQETARLV